jgi:hypothetical protein
MKRARKPIRTIDVEAVDKALTAQPWQTLKQLERATGTLDASKVISVMVCEQKYEIAKLWSKVKRKGRERSARIYCIVSRPAQKQLELTLEG